jgi:2-amino-4-hydroxy-6-hydroxymethyldihydropteridine diphosphokinase
MLMKGSGGHLITLQGESMPLSRSATARHGARVIAYVGLGSNQGDSFAHLAAARNSLAALPGVRPLQASSVYLTEPQGLREQPFFANQALALACAPKLAPEALLKNLLAVEHALGRVRSGAIRFGPRVIDLDLLLFGSLRRDGPHLTLPHPRMLERAFVLLPLAEIAPELVLPQGLSVSRALESIRFTLAGRVIYQREPLKTVFLPPGGVRLLSPTGRIC